MNDRLEFGEGATGPAAPSDFLAQLSGGDVDALLSLGATQHFPKGSLVFRAGDPGRNVYFLRRGRVKIYELSPVGREVILWFCFSGEVFGLAEVARGGGRVVNAEACEACEILVLPQDQFKSYLRSHPDAALLCMQVLASRLRILSEVLANLVSDDVNTPVAKLILRLSARYGVRAGKDILLNIPLTHQEIADMVGTTRQTVTTALGQLKRRGVLSIDSHRIQIESQELLNELTLDRS